MTMSSTPSPPFKAASRFGACLVGMALSAMMAGCATTPRVQASQVGLRPAVQSAQDGSSPYGLFLAGSAALQNGEAETATQLLKSAQASLADDDAQELVRDRAFLAALYGGDVATAATLAPMNEEASPVLWRIGQMAQAVDFLARGKGGKALAILQPSIGAPHRSTIALLVPWANASAGQRDASLVLPSVKGDRVVEYFGQFGQALLFERAGKFDKAEDVYRFLASRSGVNGAFVLDNGAFLERRGRFVEAVTLYTAALADDPTDLPLSQALARAKSKGKPPALPQINQGAARMILATAAVLTSDQQTETAFAYVRFALHLDPTNADGWIMLGDLLRDDEKNDQALAAYDRVAVSSPQYLSALGRKAWVLQSQDQSTQAISLARQAVAQFPDNQEALVTLADLLRANDQFAESARLLSQVIKAQGDASDWRLLFMRGMASEQSGDWPSAEADLKAALIKAPDEPQLLNYLGYSWIDRGERLDEGLAMVKKAVASNPRSGAMIDSLGWAYFRMGDLKQAVDLLEKAVELMPGDPEINNHLGDAYWRAGRLIEARFQWQRVLTLDPSEAVRKASEDKLKSGLLPVALPARVAGR
jgi:tetratricopeptide (TPR) repeat protein